MIYIIILAVGYFHEEENIVFNKGYKTREDAEKAGSVALELYNSDIDNEKWCFSYKVQAILVEE